MAVLKPHTTMTKTLNKWMMLLVVAFISVVSFSACTDQEEIDISYETDLTVSAAHIFDSFSVVCEGDFSMTETGATWHLNLNTFIYDSNGLLVDECSGTFNEITSTLNHKLTLNPGVYTVVSIADFEGTYNDHFYKYWNISGTNSIRELQITESNEVLSSAMETLGIDITELKITDCPNHTNIDIKPATGLVQMIIWDDDFSGLGKNGFSSLAPYIDNLTICTSQLKQVVSFDGNKPLYNYGIQAATYIMHWHSPKEQAAEGGHLQTSAFRALLPDDNKRFYWEVNTIPGAGKLLFLNGNDFQQSDLTDNSVNIEPGKQYAIDLVLDALYLFLEEYNPDIDMFERLQNHFDTYNKSLIVKTLENRYDKYVGLNKKQIESYLKMQELLTSDNIVIYNGTGLLDYITVVFEDKSFAKSKRIMLTWAIKTKEEFDRIAECLSCIYTPWEKGSTATVKQYINAKSIEDATVGISWSSNNYCLYFDLIE